MMLAALALAALSLGTLLAATSVHNASRATRAEALARSLRAELEATETMLDTAEEMIAEGAQRERRLHGQMAMWRRHALSGEAQDPRN
jgi:hypothetical protein